MKRDIPELIAELVRGAEAIGYQKGILHCKYGIDFKRKDTDK